MEENLETVEREDTKNLQCIHASALMMQETGDALIRKNISIWSYNQTKFLLKRMIIHYIDLNNPRKMKHVFENIANDMISEGFTIDSIAVQNKWKSLTRSYSKTQK